MVRYLASASVVGFALALSGPAAAMVSGAKIAAPSLIQTVQYAGLSADYSVANVQNALNQLGYDAGSVDGVMGGRTATAIREFQSAKGLAVTGRATPALYEQLRQALGQGGQARASTTAAMQVPSSAVVTDVQSELRQGGYQIPAVTGELDEPTRAAIRDYQRTAGLAVTGEPSEQLLSQLRRTTGQRDTFQQRELVQQIQQELTRRGYDVGVPDGVFGPKTRVAIRTYQSDAGLPVTGDATPTLLSSMQSGSVRANTNVASFGGPVDSGLVRQVQNELNQRGYAVGNPDGVMGERTRSAIRDFQGRTGMAVTGEPSVELLASLQQSDRGIAPGQDRRTERDMVRMEVERELSARGYVVGQIDGELDQQSRAAIRAYQRDAGIEIDGRADQQLLAHIQSSNIRAGSNNSAGSGIGRWLNERPR